MVDYDRIRRGLMDRPQTTDELFIRTFARVHAVACGVACSIVLGCGVFWATAALVVKGGEEVGPNLILLAQYFPGYSVTWQGSVIGGAYGLLFGFIGGWGLASLRNLTVTIYLHAVRLWANLSAEHFLDRFDN